MKFLANLGAWGRKARRRMADSRTSFAIETLENRAMLTASPLPVLMVIADQHDFYYQEYGDTRQSLEAEGVEVQVAATTTAYSLPHYGTGEPEGTDGGVTPDLTLAAVDAANYSAIVFVGGWGSSMYQYAFPGDYTNDSYDGDVATKQVVNDLINEFIAQDKYVAAICHGTTVLAWARVDGVSPLDGKQVSVPYIGSPAVNYQGVDYGYYQLGQYEQAVANGAIANTVSGQYGLPGTATDDVVVDGRIITAENYDAALQFGLTVAQEVKSAAENANPPDNQAPIADDVAWQLTENSAVGTVVGVVSATDPDAGQQLTYAILDGNLSHAFAIDPVTGQITVANAAAINFEAVPEFQLLVQVTDNAQSPLSDTALVTISLQNVVEPPLSGVFKFADDLVVQATSASDIIYIWSGGTDAHVCVWMNNVYYGAFEMTVDRQVVVYGGDGNDQIYATDARFPITIFGEGGHDQITGGSAGDILDGGAGVDRIWGSAGDDLILGGDGDDFLFGREGNDVLVGGAGDDYLDGDIGRDLLIGGAGSDYLKGGAGEDLLIGGLTSYDQDDSALATLQSVWIGPGSPSVRLNQLTSGNNPDIRLSWGETVQDDDAADVLWGGDDLDLVFAGLSEELYLRVDDLLVSV